MATVSIIIPDAQVDRVLAAFGYDPDGGLTKVQFAQQVIGSYLKETTVCYEARRDSQIASAAAEIKAKDEINIS